MSKIWFFDDVNLFGILCPHKFGGLSENHFKSYKKGETIYFAEDRADSIYLIAAGRVRILNYTEDGEEVVKGILGKGELFGELALLGESRRHDIAVAADGDTVLCPVSISDMHELMKDNKELSLKIYKLIGLKLRKLERRIDNLVFKDVRSRLVDFILELVDERGERKGDQWEVEHFYTHRNIGNLIGTSRQTVTTTLNELKAEGLITFDRRHFVIVDRNQLMKERAS